MIWKSNFKLFILLLMLTCWFDFSVVHVNLSLLIWLIWHFIKLRNCWGVYLLISNIGSVNQVFFLLIYCFHSIISLYLLNKENGQQYLPGWYIFSSDKASDYLLEILMENIFGKYQFEKHLAFCWERKSASLFIHKLVALWPTPWISILQSE